MFDDDCQHPVLSDWRMTKNVCKKEYLAKTKILFFKIRERKREREGRRERERERE